MAELMKEQLHGLHDNRYIELISTSGSTTPIKELSFWLNLPARLWTEVEVRFGSPSDCATTDIPVKKLPSHIQQALETRLRSLGYGVTIERRWEWIGASSQSILTTQIKLSWANK